MEVELKEHNIDTYNQVKEQLSLYGRSIVVQPTGTGKSYILMKLLQDYDMEYKVVIGSSSVVLSQLQKKPEWTNTNTICYTYQNIPKLIDLIKAYNFNIKLICIDEIHRAGAPVWERYIKELISVCKNANIVGFTATPIRYLDNKKDMVKEMFNGVSAGNLTIQQCIERGILPKNAVYCVGMLDIRQDISLRIKKLERSKKAKAEKEQAIKLLNEYENNWDRNSSIINILKDKIGTFNDKNYKHIVFVSSIEAAESMKEDIKSWFNNVYKDNNINVYVVHSKLNNSYYIMNEFCEDKNNTDIDVLICVNMANEGFHIRNTKSIIMLRYTKSPNLFIQQVGRGLASGAESPYIFDFVGNIDLISDICDLIDGNEIKVSNVFTENTFEKFKSSSYKLFKEFNDSTKEFRKTVRNVDRLMQNQWSKNFEDIQNKISNGECIENNKWFKEQQTKFISGQLSNERELQFRSLGDIAYLTDKLKAYDKDMINALNEYNINQVVSSKVEKIRYLAFIDKLPIEVWKYIKDNNINIGIDDRWLDKKCREYNEDVYTEFMGLMAMINKCRLEDINSDKKLGEYLYIINSIIKFQEKFDLYDGRMDNTSAIIYNMLNRYWKIKRSIIASHIDIDIGVLRNHSLLIKRYNGFITCDELDELTKNVDNIPSTLRSKSTNKLIQIINSLTS